MIVTEIGKVPPAVCRKAFERKSRRTRGREIKEKGQLAPPLLPVQTSLSEMQIAVYALGSSY